MPLYINDKQISSNVDCHPDKIFKNYPGLYSKSKDFLNNAVQNKTKICGKKNRLLYVGQREYAVVSKNLNKGDFDYIASDDATTCHIMYLKEPVTDTIAVAHFDGGEMDKGIKDIIGNIKSCRKLLQSNQGSPEDSCNLEMYLFGGFVDSKKYSETIFRDILQICKRQNENIELKLACCYSLNNKYLDNSNWPIIYGIGVCLKSMEFFVAECVNRGPDLLLREARLMYNDDESGNCNIYDFQHGYVFIEPFPFHSRQDSNQWLRLPDEVYLKYCSTSPHCEPEHFVRNSKSAIIFTMKYHQQIESIFRGKPRRCVLNDQFEWKYIDIVHSPLSI